MNVLSHPSIQKADNTIDGVLLGLFLEPRNHFILFIGFFCILGCFAFCHLCGLLHIISCRLLDIPIFLRIQHCQPHGHVVVIHNELHALLSVEDYLIALGVTSHETLLPLCLLLLFPFYFFLIDDFTDNHILRGGIKEVPLYLGYFHIQASC